MLNYVETPGSSTMIPVESVSCSQPRDYTASTFSYVIGPMNPVQIIILHAHLFPGEMCSLLLPVHVPPSITSHPAFRDGYEWNYLHEEEGDESEDWTKSVPRLVNHIYWSLTDTRLYRDLITGEILPDFLPWQVGWLLRDLTRFAEADHTLASVGLAHLCFLLPLLTRDRLVDWPRYEPYRAGILHDRAIKAYRSRVRFYREQGKTYDEAQRLALVGNVQ